MQIQELLNTGRNNAVSARYLCGITGLDRRTLSAAIARERKHGAAICAATEEPAGFFIAANADELASYCRSLASREKEIAAVRTACENTLETMKGVRKRPLFNSKDGAFSEIGGISANAAFYDAIDGTGGAE